MAIGIILGIVLFAACAVCAGIGKGDAQTRVLVAQAEADAIKVKSLEVARMLGFEITADGDIDFTGKTPQEIALVAEYLKFIEYLSTWDGELPTVVAGDNTGIILPVQP